MPAIRQMAWLAAVLGACGLGAPVATAAPATFTASAVTQPADGSELFFDADTGSGAVTVAGTVNPALDGVTGDLLCYGAPGTAPFTVSTQIPVSGGRFSRDVSLRAIASRACRLRFVPHGNVPSGSAATPFAGPAVSVSERATESSGGNEYGYYVLSGTLPWSFAFGSLGQCAVGASYSTDVGTLGSFPLFDGNDCLPAFSGVGPARGHRSAVQVDGLNAYPPGAIPSLTGLAGFAPLTYTAGFDALHDSVTIIETDDLVVCQPPGGYPPTTSGNCPGLTASGVAVTQTTSLLPGAQVARVTQRFTSVDGRAHALDLLFGESVVAPADGEVPAFEFPGQSELATHGAPDTFALFGGGPGSILAVADGAATPATTNPIGAITYGQPPLEADFVSGAAARTASFVLHYAEKVPAGGAVTLSWSFSDASGLSGLTPLIAVETDRYYTPSVRLLAPRRRVIRDSPLLVRGIAGDHVGVASAAVNGVGVALAADGMFVRRVPLRRGVNVLRVAVTNLAGNTRSVTRHLIYRPGPCVVPRLRGLGVAAARRLLVRRYCRAGRILHRRSVSVRRGSVIATIPRSGAKRRHGARVQIVVSSG
jgi:hypothetical protein